MLTIIVCFFFFFYLLELFREKKSQETNSVQEVGSYTLDSSIQDVLEVTPELLTKFCVSMDDEDDFGNGWKR